ncbi:hypothetical protein [Phaeodactylibacter xiamenensis]|uniref:hypothetical protein n=1 Tax=Phaeodactylibacter xiamenensis TaxID=1524460 RepID=UPI003CCBEC4E
MNIQKKQDLFGDLQLSIIHAALSEPIVAGHADPEQAAAKLVEQIVVRSKDIAHKYLGVVKNSKGSYLNMEDRQAFDQAKDALQGLRRNTPLPRLQSALSSFLPLANKLMSSPQSRFRRSQEAKINFLTVVAEFSPEALKAAGYVSL